MTEKLKMDARWNFQTCFKTNGFDLKILIAEMHY